MIKLEDGTELKFDNRNQFKRYLGYLGEAYVQLELAKRNFRVFKTMYSGIDFIGENGVRIEVKTALAYRKREIKRKNNKIYTYRRLKCQFRILEKQTNSDVFVCVVMKNVLEPPIAYFVIPKEYVTSLGKSNMIVIYRSDLTGHSKVKGKVKLNIFKNNFKIITEYEKYKRILDKEGVKRIILGNKFVSKDKK